MNKILFIAHYFPPSGGGGVQRSAKFVKYLPEFGIMPLVLTGSGGIHDRWSHEDASLLEDIPSEVSVFRTNGDVSYRFNRNREESLVALGERVIAQYRPDAIFVTLSPLEDARVAQRLAEHYSLPWIADLRDPWALDEFQVYRTALHRVVDRARMGRTLRRASAVVMNTPEAAARLLHAFPALRNKRIGSITNGYDSRDFGFTTRPEPRPGQFTIVHAGALHTDAGLRQRRRSLEYTILGRKEWGVDLLCRSHYFLLKALERWAAEDSAIKQVVRVVLCGVLSDLDKELVARSAVAPMIEITGYLPHHASVRMVRSADILFLPMHKLPSGRRATIVPGKTYEYLAAGIPVLGAVPPGDARDYLEQSGTGFLCEPDDVDEMFRILKTQFLSWKSGVQHVRINSKFVEQFERRELTKRLAEVIAGVVGADVSHASVGKLAMTRP